jgi:uncharacterized protein YbjQ (UPF0145 family)
MSTQDQPALAEDLPGQARARISEMRERKLFTSDLSVNEFVLVREAGFEPVGLVMGTSIYHVAPQQPGMLTSHAAGELETTTKALNHARTLAMNRMEEEAEALGADGVIGVRLTVNLALDPQRAQWQQYRVWKKWADEIGFRRPPTVQPAGWFQGWETLAASQWKQWTARNGWTQVPQAPWQQATSKASYALGANTAEFIAVGTAIRHRDGEHYRNKQGKPFQSDLSGQDFWLLIKSGYRPVGFVMGNCVYYVPPSLLQSTPSSSAELTHYTHALYDARELAIERLQDEAEALGAVGIVGVTVSEEQHSWRNTPVNVGNAALQTGEVIELFVIGTAVVPSTPGELGRAALILSANDQIAAAGEGGE